MLGAMAWIALAAAAFFAFRSEHLIASQTSALRAFDLHARETADSLSDLRVAQQAYVAAGQGVAFWVAKVATTGDAVRASVAALRNSATAPGARAALDEAGASVTQFGEIDKRALEYINQGQTLMAGDVIFADGGQAAAKAARHVEAARLAEHLAADATEAAIRKQQALAIVGAAVFAGIAVLMLVPVRLTAFAKAMAVRKADTTYDGGQADETEAPTVRLTPEAVGGAHPAYPALPAHPAHRAPPAHAAVLKTTAELATDFGRVRDLSDLKGLLERAANVMDASGLVVWLGSTTGADLQPIVSHGYSPQVIARMPAVPRSADNAAAAAYRTGSLQIVLSRPGGSPGALVAPLLAPDGCIGSLSAEIRGGGEGSETVQALAAIFASHLAGIFAATATDAGESKAANQ